MPFLVRLRYALYLAIVLSAAVSLVVMLASADAIQILPASAFNFAMSPSLFLVAFAVGYLVAPAMSKRFPIKRDWQKLW
jgi:hypothetical protein